MSYDGWKTNIPEGSPWCEVCGEREIETRFGIGDIKVCGPCFDELDAADDLENGEFQAARAEDQSSRAANLKGKK